MCGGGGWEGAEEGLVKPGNMQTFLSDCNYSQTEKVAGAVRLHFCLSPHPVFSLFCAMLLQSLDLAGPTHSVSRCAVGIRRDQVIKLFRASVACVLHLKT